MLDEDQQRRASEIAAAVAFTDWIQLIIIIIIIITYL